MQFLRHLPPSAGYHPPMPLKSGETFAGFSIIRLLGSGGMGEVYLAEHPRLPRRDALKVLKADLSADPEYRARFNREADLASTLWHPHIVSVHDRGEYEGQLWISMDYVDGVDAGRLMANRFPAGMPLHQVVRIVTAVAGALDYAHKQGLLHRDIKPANIMLSHFDDEDEQRILLADFGIARNVDDISGLTTTNMTVGTVAYSAPEQLMGEEIDGCADQYALAATAYHLLTGSQLFPHSNPAVVISRHLNAAPPVLADTRPELAALDSALAVALAKDPKDRFPRCADFARALADQNGSPSSGVSAVAPTLSAPAQQQPTPNTVTSAPAEPSTTASSRPWLIPAVAGAALVIGVGAVFAWHPWSRNTPSTDVATSTSSAPPPVTSTTTSTTPPPPPPPPVFPAANISSLLLTPSEIYNITGDKFTAYAPGSPPDLINSSLGTSDNKFAIDPSDCVGVIFGAEQQVYGDSGYEAIRDQTLGKGTSSIDGLVEQTVAVFSTPEQAQAVLASSTAQWRKCASGHPDRPPVSGWQSGGGPAGILDWAGRRIREGLGLVSHQRRRRRRPDHSANDRSRQSER